MGLPIEVPIEVPTEVLNKIMCRLHLIHSAFQAQLGITENDQPAQR